MKSTLTCFCNEFRRLRTITLFFVVILLLLFKRFSITCCFNNGTSPSKINMGIAPTNNKLQVRKNKFLVKKKLLTCNYLTYQLKIYSEVLHDGSYRKL